MKNFVLTFFALVAFNIFGQAQQNFYDVTPGDGNGLRFWQDDAYKIHMGNSSEYHFGPVTDYAIKLNMNNDYRRGWVWGIYGTTPIAALSTEGNMQIAGMFKSERAIVISSVGDAADASLHIRSSYGGLDRLTQIHPSGISKPALNIMGSTDASLNYNWWSWGVLTNGSWAMQPGANFSGSTGLFITNSGNVGIGATSPNQKLTVNGTIYGKEVKVDLSVPGPDYVFEKDYELPSLDQVQSYINENKHLPEVPSAKEMEKSGINLSEMNMLLLKKVEELTLYMIEMKKAGESQKQEIQKLTLEVEGLRKK